MKKSNENVSLQLYIFQIANIITVNAQRVDMAGLLYGHIGIVLFLFHYAKYMKNEQYEKNASDLLDFVIENHMKKMGHRFSDGLHGIGWAIKYLGLRGFIKVSNDALEDYDALLKEPFTKSEFVYEMSCDIPVFSRAIYCTENLNRKKVEEMLSLLYGLLTAGNEIKYELCTLNSIMYFLAKCSLNNEYKKLIQPLLPLLSEKVEASFYSGKYTNGDVFILKCLKQKVLIDVDISIVKFNCLLDILCNWQTIIYSDILDISRMPVPELISSYILKMNSNVNIKELSLCGLSSLGINLMILSQKYKVAPTITEPHVIAGRCLFINNSGE